MSEKINVTIWNEFRHEKKHDAVKAVYPDGIHKAIADELAAVDAELNIRCATLDEPENGLTDEILASTDVMLWWGHMAHGDVADTTVAKVRARVLEGMGLIVLHSGHYSKIFKALMGTTCSLNWREVGEKEVLWVCQPAHPIVQGIGTCICLEHTEMYGEPFGIPEADETIFISNFEGGEAFRSGCVWRRGCGKVFYFRPGHETFPIFHEPKIVRVIDNAIHYLKPTIAPVKDSAPNRTMGWFRDEN